MFLKIYVQHGWEIYAEHTDAKEIPFHISHNFARHINSRRFTRHWCNYKNELSDKLGHGLLQWLFFFRRHYVSSLLAQNCENLLSHGLDSWPTDMINKLGHTALCSISAFSNYLLAVYWTLGSTNTLSMEQGQQRWGSHLRKMMRQIWNVIMAAKVFHWIIKLGLATQAWPSEFNPWSLDVQTCL